MGVFNQNIVYTVW